MQSLDQFSANETRRVVQLGFAGILLLVLIYAITSLYYIRENTNHLTEIVEINNTLVTHLYKMRDLIRQRQILLNQMLASKDPFVREELSHEFFQLAGPFRKSREIVQQLPVNKSETVIFNALVNEIKVAQPINRDAVKMILQATESQASRKLVEQAKILQSNLLQRMEELITERKIHEKEFVREGKQAYETVFFGSVISAFFILLLIVMIARITAIYVSRKNNELLLKNAELEKVSTLALEATHTKSAFLATMSHEIRTPLTAIIGFAEINLEHNVSEENRVRHTRSIVRNGKHLLQIINDILDISKVEANCIEYAKDPYNLFQLFHEVEQIILPQIKEKGLGLLIDYDYPIPEKVIGDSFRLKQVLLNICANAIKFTDSGRINIKVSFDNDRGDLNIEIIDTGIGMTNEQLETIFDVFTQADSSITRKYGGTGLGLALSKQFIEGMGGRIKVFSLKDIGSRFSISIKSGDVSEFSTIDGPSQVHAEHKINSDKANLIREVNGKILVVEDNKDNQQLFTILLEKTGAEVKIANNGLQAVEKVTNEHFDLVFMDMQMPVMDGLEATKLIKSKGYKVPVVSLTANAMKQDREASLAAGCSDYITKPVNKLDLYHIVYKYLEPGDGVAEISREPDNNIIDNDPDIINLKNKFIESLPVKLEKIQKAFELNHFDVVKTEVHKLKGLGGSFGCSELTALSLEIEKSLINNDIDICRTLIEKMDDMIDRIIKRNTINKIS